LNTLKDKVIDFGEDWEEHPLSGINGKPLMTTGKKEWWIQAIIEMA